MNATPSRSGAKPAQVRKQRGKFRIFTPAVQAPAVRAESARFPGGWFELSEMHEDFWSRVAPILNEMRRLRRRHAIADPSRSGAAPLCPPHVEWSLKNYEDAIERIHRGIFRTAPTGETAGEPRGFHTARKTRAETAAQIPLPYENDEKQRRAA